MSSREKKTCNRRQFLGHATFGGMMLAASWPLAVDPADDVLETSGKPSEGTELEALRQAFLHPPDSAKPMTRWWWFGGAMSPEEITRELGFMRDAGIRGVELQPLYPVEVDDPRRGIKNHSYFSPEFLALLRHTVRETQRLGLQFDLTLGSGWPYGGPFIPVELAARRLRVLSQTFAGPGEFSWDLTPQILAEDQVVAAVAAPLLPSGQPGLERARVLTDQVKPKMEHNLHTGTHISGWEAPAGLWTIMIFLDSPTLMQVKRPTLGMEGNVLDHFSRQAVELFLSAVGTRVLRDLKQVAEPPIHAIFCDSLEVYGADWTSDFLKEFERRRGYDLTPYLPALWADAGPLTPYVRFDYHETLSELTLENFFRPLARWSQQHGLQLRAQAHGAFGDVMRAYSLADIPEGENIFGGDSYQVNLKHRRLASSAGHLYQKPVISGETYTWLRVPLFLTTLEMMKAASDAMFLDGINHIVNHGYPASPLQAGEPGWVFYASTVINHNNTWWRHYPNLARYIQRVQTLLARGMPVNPIAVYLPLADVYSTLACGGVHMDVEIENRLGREPLAALRRAGYDFDLIHDHALSSLARVEDGKLRAGDGTYSAVVIPGAEFMPPESLERLVEFVRGGGLAIFVGRVPHAPPGLADLEARQARLRAAIGALWGGTQPKVGDVRKVGAGKTALVADYAAALVGIEKDIAPDFFVLDAGDSSEEARRRARENVGFVHRRSGMVDSYFVSNVSAHRQDLRVQFGVGRARPEKWNPEAGTCDGAVVYQYAVAGPRNQEVTEVQLRLEPFESCFVVFAPPRADPTITRTNFWGPLEIEQVRKRTRVGGLASDNGDYWLETSKGKRHRVRVQGLPSPLEMKGPWALTLGEGPAFALPQLRSWTDLPEGKGYSGWGQYETNFDLPSLGQDIEWLLDLGRVHETAEVILNGISLGAAWYGQRRVKCQQALRPGRNHLVVAVANLWIHKVRSQPSPDHKQLAATYGIRWGRYGEIEPGELPPSGLLGPVQLIPLKRWRMIL